MDDDLVLNLAAASNNASHNAARAEKKGGRWTDRLKAKRSNKRKLREEQKHTNVRERPTKKARIEQTITSKSGATLANESRFAAAPNRPTQIISSLFSYNPKIDTPFSSKTQSLPSAPSNAPLADSSDFTGLGLNHLLSSHLDKKMNIRNPTSIQRSALPILLEEEESPLDERDVFIQAQTGSGKTLSFLLPIIQDLLPLSSLSYIDRSIGTLAIIIAPTRELAQQISDVLEKLLQLRLRPEDESAEDGSSARLTRWLVSGVLTGGATRTHEKARLRRGLPILVSTPGRLLDHLQNTSSFNVGKCRWLILDEADRLMDLGFEETIKGILQGLDGRRKLALAAVEKGTSMEVGGWNWERRRRTILCSATIEENVQKLAGMTLTNPVVIKALSSDKKGPVNDANQGGQTDSSKFTPPSQLSQKYVIAPLKLRLVTLVALLRSLVAQSAGRRTLKIIVFLSCTDSVDYHWRLLGNASIDDNAQPGSSPVDGDRGDSDGERLEDEAEKIYVQSPLIPKTSIYRLHGSLPTPIRMASLKGFSTVSEKGGSTATSSILLCTSVAARGLDLPLVRAVIQYDLPTEGGETEYIHRVGRTARAGKGGEAWSFVAPSETEWVNWVQCRMSTATENERNVTKELSTLVSENVDDVLKAGFGGNGNEFEQRATDVQLAFERWVLRNKENTSLARKAYLSHMRAYATHPSDEKHVFHIRNLHLGHLAKAFALRDAPKTVTSNKSKAQTSTGLKSAKGRKGSSHATSRKGMESKSDGDERHKGEAERRMQAVVRAQGRLTKERGAMVSKGVAEFQIAGGYDLEKMVGSF